MYSVTWSERAARDFDELLQFIGRENPANARLVATRVLKTLGMLESFSLGQQIGEGVFKLYIPKTSYFVLFRRNDEADISIRAFIHSARDWQHFDWEAF
jgi:plasmid stabilization system protein ParE